MRLSRAISLGSSLCLCAAARAVYAPIPDQEQGKDLTVSSRPGITYNSNIFGAATSPIGSVVYEVSPKVTWNTSVTDQTFFSASFHPTLDYFDNRPGKKTRLQPGDRRARGPRLLQDLDAGPERRLFLQPEPGGAPERRRRSIRTRRSRATSSTGASRSRRRRSSAWSSRPAACTSTTRTRRSGTQLNRFENLYGAEADFTLLPDVKLAGEYRHQDVDYSNNASTNNKHSDFLMAGFDYAAGPKMYGEHASWR